MLRKKEKLEKQKQKRTTRKINKREQGKNLVLNSGITLIALVITIIVILILARSKY